MAHILKLRVVAEGVETGEQLNLLHSYHCDDIQGYYCFPPLPPEAFIQLLTGNYTLYGARISDG